DEHVDGQKFSGWVGKAPAVGPVDLGLLARWCLEAHGQLAQTLLLGLERMQKAAQRGDRAAITHGPNFRQQAHRRKAAFFIAVAQVLLVSVQARSALRFLEARESPLRATHAGWCCDCAPSCAR